MEFFQPLIAFAMSVWDLFIHLDVHLAAMAQTMGPWLYLLLFAVIFCETGLVVMPILPGDSLLFAAGALAALDGSPLHVWLLGVLLFIAAVLGDACNYAIGKNLGPKVFAADDSWLLNKKHLEHTRAFYDKHGGKTIIIARFIPIVRTFAPFVAGIGRMPYKRFGMFNVVGAFVWVWPFLLAGFWMGNQPVVKDNFHIIIVAIIIISVIPAVVEFVRAKRHAQRAA